MKNNPAYTALLQKLQQLISDGLKNGDDLVELQQRLSQELSEHSTTSALPPTQS